MTSRSKPAQSSRIANNGTLPSVDGRSAWARLAKATMQALIEHAGGEARVSEPMRLACRRAATLECELVHMESSFANLHEAGKEPEAAALELFGQMVDRQRRLLAELGWTRAQRPVKPTQSLAEMLGDAYAFVRDDVR